MSAEVAAQLQERLVSRRRPKCAGGPYIGGGIRRQPDHVHVPAHEIEKVKEVLIMPAEDPTGEILGTI